MEKVVRVGVGVLIVDGTKVLLGKRNSSHGVGTFAAPGGHLEFGEDIIACAKREVFEETGLELSDFTLGPYVNSIFSDEKHYVTLFVIAEYTGGKIENKEPDRCEGWEWYELSKLPSPLFLPLDKLVKSGYSPFR
jgi:8-oxo-dGTP diphosphatase